MQDITEVLVVLGVVLACFVVRYIVQWWYLAYRRKLEQRSSPQTVNSFNITVSRNSIGTNTPPPEFEYAVKHSAHVSYIQMDECPPSYAEYEKSVGKDLPNVHISIVPEDKVDKRTSD